MDEGAGKQKKVTRARSEPLPYSTPKKTAVLVALNKGPTYDELIKAGKKTWEFPTFPLELLDPFKQWLMSAEGKLRNENTAKEICVDVSKCLRFHHKMFSWDRLLDTSTTMKFMNV